jgi:hypothetical protein
LQGDIYDLWKETRLIKANTLLLTLYEVLTKCEEFYKQQAHLIANAPAHGWDGLLK